MDPAVDGPAIRARLGVCPQEDTLDTELSIRDNLVVYGRYFGLSRAESSAPAATMSDLERKARDFRRKKLVRNSAIPGWYKQRHGGKSHIMSGAARVKKYRPRASSTSSGFAPVDGEPPGSCASSAWIPLSTGRRSAPGWASARRRTPSTPS